MAVNTIDRTGAGALIPTEIARQIIQEAPQSSKLLPLMRRLPNMSTKQRTMPILASLPIAGFVNGDTGQKSTTKAEWSNLELTAEEIAVIVPIPEAVLADANYDIWAEIKPRIVEAFGSVIDSAILFGTNKPASWPEGIIPQAVAKGNNVAQGTNLDLASDIIGKGGVMNLVETDGYRVTGFMTDSTFEADLRDLRDANRNLMYAASLTANVPSTLLGRPITFDNSGVFDLDTALMVGGDWSKAVYAIRQDITYKVLTEAVIQDTDGSIAYNLAQQDMVALRCVMRLGWQLANPINRRNVANANRFPFAVLQPKAGVEAAAAPLRMSLAPNAGYTSEELDGMDLAGLKEVATENGVDYAANIGADTLRARIKTALGLA